MRRALPLWILLAALAAPAHAALDDVWRSVPTGVPADSLGRVLGGLESRTPPGVGQGEIAYALGAFHYARGEYVQALAAFERAGVRLVGEERLTARYFAGLSLLAVGAFAEARPVFDEVARAGGERSALAKLALAQCWDAANRPEQAYAELRELLAGAPGEAGPAALERFAELAMRFHRDDEAHAARERLARDYPRSIEAARLPVAAPRSGAR
ncbi:MAG TPA: tetratricopeptide repeat protein [Candidatus Acidoferrales bacterium]|nr:tetratricopeptide repeat protein [Candidatus Acidoferrales bacterium]